MSGENNLRAIHDPELRPVAVTRELLALAQDIVEKCSACNLEAEIPFDLVIQYVADEPEYLGYVLPATAICPNCKAEIHEKTLVQPIGNPDAANWI